MGIGKIGLWSGQIRTKPGYYWGGKGRVQLGLFTIGEPPQAYRAFKGEKNRTGGSRPTPKISGFLQVRN